MSDPIEIPILAPFDPTGANAAIRAFEQLKKAAAGTEQAGQRQTRTTKDGAKAQDAYARALQRTSKEALGIAQAQARAMAAAGQYEGAVRKLNTALQQAEVVNLKQGAAVQAQITRYQQAAAAAQQAAGAQAQMTATSSGLSGALGGMINPATLAAGAIAAIGAAAVAASDNQRDLEKTQNTLRALAGSQELYNRTVAAAREQQRLFGGSLRDNIDGLTGLVTLSRSTGAELQKLIDISQRLSVKDPSQGIGGARIALQEALTGDPTSLARRYEIPRAALAKLRDESVSTGEKLQLLDQYLNDIGISSEAVATTTPVMTERINQLAAAMESASIYAGTMINGLLELAVGSDEAGSVIEKLTEGITDTSAMYQRMFDLMQAGIPINEAFAQAVHYVAVQADNVRGGMDKAAQAIDAANSKMLTWLNLQSGGASSALARFQPPSVAAGGGRKPGQASSNFTRPTGRGGGGGGGGSSTSAAERAQRAYETAQDRASDAAEAAAERQADYDRDLARKQADAAADRGDRLASIEQELQDKLTDIRANAAQRQADVERQSADQLASIRKNLAQRLRQIDQQEQDARAQASRSLAQTIARTQAQTAVQAEIADVTGFAGGATPQDTARQAQAQARHAALAAAAAEASAASDPAVGGAIYAARQEQIDTLTQLDEAYAEKRVQFASNPQALAALQTQYEEAKAAAENAAQVAIQAAQQEADLRIQAIQRAKEEARKAAEDERREVVAEKRRQTEEIAREAQSASDRAIVEAQRQRDEVAKTFAEQQEAIQRWADDAERNLQKVIDKANEATDALNAIPAPKGASTQAADAASVPGKAAGGPVMAGQPYLVGERGPEYFVPRTSGAILPSGVVPGGAGMTANITIQAGGMNPQGIADTVIRELDRRMRGRT